MCELHLSFNGSSTPSSSSLNTTVSGAKVFSSDFRHNRFVEWIKKSSNDLRGVDDVGLTKDERMDKVAMLEQLDQVLFEETELRIETWYNISSLVLFHAWSLLTHLLFLLVYFLQEPDGRCEHDWRRPLQHPLPRVRPAAHSPPVCSRPHQGH